MRADELREQAGGHLAGFGSAGYRAYVLNFLLLIYILNFVDRNLLAVVAPQLKPELGISDTAFGLLTGFGFALLYTIVGIPLAQFAEHGNRVKIMSFCVVLWSVMTALCGLAAEITIGGVVIGAFWVLLFCRVGVGIGEAGCTPPANSLISDYFPSHRRSTALGYYAMGVTLGGMLANLIGGPITDAFGWRIAFFVVGLPGVLIGLLFFATVKEPPRGYSEPAGARPAERPSFTAGMRALAGKRSFWWMTAGATIAAFCGYGITSFQSLFITRSFGLTTGEAAVFINVPVAAASALGTVLTGWLAGRLVNRSATAIAWLPGLGLILSVPFYVMGFTTGSLWLAAAGLCIGGCVKYGYLAAQYTIAQAVVSPRFRAVSTAILLFVVNLLGYGLGPLFIGAVSDILFKAKVASLGAGELTRQACEGGLADLSVRLVDVCAVAHPESLQDAMLITAALYALAGLCLLIAARYLREDTWAG
jgi:predicted MFS family arabinose efflux permease